jgi:glycosyltransferase involved in cell wall biosynthesis
MVAYTFYENDNRVMRYSDALVADGHHVDVVALRRPGQGSYVDARGVHLYRIQKRLLDEKRGKMSYMLRLIRFLIKSAYWLAVRHIQKPYDAIHVHSVPDFEVFAAFVPRMLGCKVILDIHDIVPEFYCSKFGVTKESTTFRLLALVEKYSIAFAHHVIIANHLWRERLLERSVRPSKCSVVLNYPDPRIFHARPRTRADDDFVMMYPGTINYHQGLDIAVRAFSRIRNQIPNARFEIYGEGPDRRELMQLIDSLGLSDRIRINDGIPMNEVAVKMSQADLGVVPKRSDTFGDEAFSTKSLEFMTLGVPLLMSATTIDRYYFDDTVVQFFESGSEADLADKILELYRNPERRKALAKNAGRFVADLSWDRRKQEYFSILTSLGIRSA